MLLHIYIYIYIYIYGLFIHNNILFDHIYIYIYIYNRVMIDILRDFFTKKIKSHSLHQICFWNVDISLIYKFNLSIIFLETVFALGIPKRGYLWRWLRFHSSLFTYHNICDIEMFTYYIEESFIKTSYFWLKAFIKVSSRLHQRLHYIFCIDFYCITDSFKE